MAKSKGMDLWWWWWRWWKWCILHVSWCKMIYKPWSACYFFDRSSQVKTPGHVETFKRLDTTEVCSTFFWILASETSSFKASMVGEPRGSEPASCLPSGFGWLSNVLFGGCVDGCMDGGLDGHTFRNLTGFCWVPAFWFSLKVLYTPLKTLYIYMPKKRPPYWKGDTCSIIFQTIIFGI